MYLFFHLCLHLWKYICGTCISLRSPCLSFKSYNHFRKGSNFHASLVLLVYELRLWIFIWNIFSGKRNIAFNFFFFFKQTKSLCIYPPEWSTWATPKQPPTWQVPGLEAATHRPSCPASAPCNPPTNPTIPTPPPLPSEGLWPPCPGGQAPTTRPPGSTPALPSQGVFPNHSPPRTSSLTWTMLKFHPSSPPPGTLCTQDTPPTIGWPPIRVTTWPPIGWGAWPSVWGWTQSVCAVKQTTKQRGHRVMSERGSGRD